MSSSPELPKGWKGPKESSSHPGKFYYYNPHTGEKSWTRPVGSKREREEGEEETKGSPKKQKVDTSDVKEVQVLHLLRKHKDSRRPSS